MSATAPLDTYIIVHMCRQAICHRSWVHLRLAAVSHPAKSSAHHHPQTHMRTIAAQLTPAQDLVSRECLWHDAMPSKPAQKQSVHTRSCATQRCSATSVQSERPPTWQQQATLVATSSANTAERRAR